MANPHAYLVHNFMPSWDLSEITLRTDHGHVALVSTRLCSVSQWVSSVYFHRHTPGIHKRINTHKHKADNVVYIFSAIILGYMFYVTFVSFAYTNLCEIHWGDKMCLQCASTTTLLAHSKDHIIHPWALFFQKTESFLCLSSSTSWHFSENETFSLFLLFIFHLG